MPMKQTGRKVYKSMQGKQVDMDMLRSRNELTPAVGNARVNARGDLLGEGGKIVKKREDMYKEYYASGQGVPAEIAKSRKATAPASDIVNEPTAEELEEF